MTQPAIPTHLEYFGDGGNTMFTFPFPIVSHSELEVRQNGIVMVDDLQYDVATVAGVPGGLITFRIPPPSGAVVSIRLYTAFEQLLDLMPNSPLPALSLERQLDQIVKMIQVLAEELSRRPQLAVGVSALLRHIVFPTPQPLKLWGWDATGHEISYFDPAIVQVLVDESPHLTWGENIVNVPTVNGATQLEAAAVFPAGCLRVSAVVRVTTTFGAAGQLTTFSAGSADTVDLWGYGLARTVTSAPIGANNPGVWNRYELSGVASAESVFLTADSGAFDNTGAARVTGTYLVFTAA